MLGNNFQFLASERAENLPNARPTSMRNAIFFAYAKTNATAQLISAFVFATNIVQCFFSRPLAIFCGCIVQLELCWTWKVIHFRNVRQNCIHVQMRAPFILTVYPVTSNADMFYKRRYKQ